MPGPTSNPIFVKLTDAGLAAAAAVNGGPAVQITHIAAGTGQYVPTGEETALVNRRITVPVAGGGGVPGEALYRLHAAMKAAAGQEFAAGEIGFYLGNPSAGGTLFGVASRVGQPYFFVGSEYVVTSSYSLELAEIDTGSVEVSVDPDYAAVLAAIGNHEVDPHPHPVYVLRDEFDSQFIGSVLHSHTVNRPPTYVRRDGRVCNRLHYPELWDFALHSGMLVSEAEWFSGRRGSFSSGDGATNFRLPDMRGSFERVWADSDYLAVPGAAGPDRDAGRIAGSEQDADAGPHRHLIAHKYAIREDYVEDFENTNPSPPGVTNPFKGLGRFNTLVANNLVRRDLLIGSSFESPQLSGTSRDADVGLTSSPDGEGRPFNIALPSFLKAHSFDKNPSSQPYFAERMDGGSNAPPSPADNTPDNFSFDPVTVYATIYPDNQNADSARYAEFISESIEITGIDYPTRFSLSLQSGQVFLARGFVDSSSHPNPLRFYPAPESEFLAGDYPNGDLMRGGVEPVSRNGVAIGTRVPFALIGPGDRISVAGRITPATDESVHTVLVTVGNITRPFVITVIRPSAP